MAGASFLRRSTNFPSGIAAGGGDTSWGVQPQITMLTKRIKLGFPKTMLLPKGTIILEAWVLIDPLAPATAGTVSIVNSTNSITYLAAGPANATLKTVLTPSVLLTDVNIVITATGTDNPTIAGLRIIPQRFHL